MKKKIKKVMLNRKSEPEVRQLMLPEGWIYFKKMRNVILPKCDKYERVERRGDIKFLEFSSNIRHFFIEFLNFEV